jgi:hypothetical protein
MVVEKPRTERFDDAFKLLLVIMTLSLSMGIGFYKEILEFRAFSYTIGFFVFTIVLWVFAHLRGGKDEYTLKIVAWWAMMVGFGTLFARLNFITFLLPPMIVSLIALLGLFLTLLMVYYLKENLGQTEPKKFALAYIIVTAFFVILDMLYFFGFISFPLFS